MIRSSRYLLFLLLVHTAVAKLRTFELNISRRNVNPDCFNQSYPVLVVNDQFPGPPIRVTNNDDVHIIVRNKADVATTIHYHGIFQIGTTEADGMPNVTQAAIAPGEEYHQYFKVINQAGTYFYHAHVDLHDDSAYGPFIVYDSEEAWPEHSNGRLSDGPFEYDDERVLMLSEWWHQNDNERLEYYMGKRFNGVKAADSYLINGRTIYDPANEKDDCNGFSSIDVQQGKVYRLRIIGSMTFASLGLSIAQHTMTIIEVDGNLVKPYQTSFLDIASGQRFSVLISADQAPESYYMNTAAYVTDPSSNGKAVIRYVTGGDDSNDSNDNDDNDDNDDNRALGVSVPGIFGTSVKAVSVPAPPDVPTTFSQWVFPQLTPLIDQGPDFGKPPDRTIILSPIEQRVSPGNTTRWYINGHAPPEWDEPLIEQLTRHQHPWLNKTAIRLNRAGITDGYDHTLQTYPMNYGEVVDIVLHTAMLSDGTCAGHPWHTHGMVHYAIANGQGQYIHQRDKYIRTYPTPIPKDVTFVYGLFPVPPNTPVGTLCTWTKIRLHLINPGLWAFHCHITSHMLQGMMTILEVAPHQIEYLQRNRKR
ncbi:hypothetical protein DFQ28_007326 [Apophysomyces sp. BC1034]|nr:hypothetical protein DFQ30_005519 [Apophysomyces sp. BC1015]KAG0177737.1 hypothetical protein DFQ29_004489 [Apophysomyces sp. BC1021]KAG0186760.1 hypothetical protein DFQ28_007326 [Apophysomyces sp. BC1034]